MGASIEWGEIAAVAVREKIGERAIVSINPEVDESSVVTWLRDRGLSWLANGVAYVAKLASRFKGWLIEEKLGSLEGISLQSTLGIKNRVEDFIWNFNINVTDADLLNQLRSEWIALGSQLGGAVGCTIGWAWGTIEAAAIEYAGGSAIEGLLGLMDIPIAIVDRDAMKLALKDTVEEGLQEIKALFKQVLQTGIYLGVKTGASLAFINARKWIKYLNRKGQLDWLPETWQEKISIWGEPGTAPWSLAIARESMIDSIPSDWWRGFVDNLTEEARECQIEAGFVFAHSLSAHKQAHNILGQPETLEIYPERDTDERVVVHGNTNLIKPVVTEVMAHYQIMEHKDVGQIVGQRVDEAVLQQMPDQSLKLHITWSPRRKPPWSKRSYVNERQLTNADIIWHEPEITIPWLKASSLDWEKIKRAAGGVSGFVTGNILYRSYIGFPDKGLAGQQFKIYAESESVGLDMLKSLGELSEAEVHSTGMGQRRYNPTLESGAGKKAADQRKERKPLRVYPRFCWVTAYRRMASEQADENAGRVNLTGRYSHLRRRIELWPDDEPLTARAVLEELREWHTPAGF